MLELYQNKYRIPSHRLRGWDYSNNGCYFITIVTAERQMLFGDIREGKMVLNEMGQIVQNEFFKSFEIREELFLGAFVLMPDHLHTVIILDNMKKVPEIQQHTGDKTLHRPPKSISSFVAGFKSATVQSIDNWIDTNGSSMGKFNRRNPLWQANYHDHIIRNENEYRAIVDYIDENPVKWDTDNARQ